MTDEGERPSCEGKARGIAYSPSCQPDGHCHTSSCIFERQSVQRNISIAASVHLTGKVPVLPIRRVGCSDNDGGR